MSDSHPFVSRKAQAIFYLTQMDGESRAKALKIDYGHYVSERHAKVWYDDLVKILGPRDEENTEALEKLNELYERMTYQGDED